LLKSVIDSIVTRHISSKSCRFSFLQPIDAECKSVADDDDDDNLKEIVAANNNGRTKD